MAYNILQDVTTTKKGTVISPAVSVRAYHFFSAPPGTPVVGDTITVSLLDGQYQINPDAGTLSGTLVKTTDADGIVVFDDLSVDTVGVKILRFQGVVSGGKYSAGFWVLNELEIIRQPTDVDVTAEISPIITVQLTDGADIVLASGIPITVSLATGTGSLSGNLTQAINPTGETSFTNLSVNMAGVKSLLFSAACQGVTVVSNNFTVREVYNLSFTQIPTDTNADAPISPAVTVQLKDISNINVNQAGFSISVALTTGDGTLSGTLSRVTNSSGVATFDNLSVNLIGSKTLTASLTTSNTTCAPISATFSVVEKLAFEQQPTDTNVDSLISPAVTVRLKTETGINIHQSGIPITLSKTSGTGTLSGTLTQVTNPSGVATFDDLSINLAGLKEMTAAGDFLESAISDPFLISAIPNAPTNLKFKIIKLYT